MSNHETAFLNESWEALPDELETELGRILHYWQEFAADRKRGGFYGRIDEENKVHENAPRGSVLNARILWAFSAAFNRSQNHVYLQTADRAYEYIRNYLTDPVYGGLYWSVDYEGKMLQNHKQVYAQALGIYGLSEYYRASKNPEALEQALQLYRLVEQYSRDTRYGGYIDAFSREWNFLEDKRLSEKDENASKTMNTHLHIVEAYANLYSVHPTENIKENIRQLLVIFDNKIMHRSSHHLGLFFSDNWLMDDRIISYGHDIEAGWLLQSCAESIADEDLVLLTKENAIAITRAAMEGLDEDGGLWYEFNNENGMHIFEKHWWPQAEALVGFCNAWQLTDDFVYKNALLKCWQFIQNHILDLSRGEWFWGVDKNSHQLPGQDKAGIWKCPYHNSRACLELLKRLKA